jgi:hypothetical protein
MAMRTPEELFRIASTDISVDANALDRELTRIGFILDVAAERKQLEICVLTPTELAVSVHAIMCFRKFWCSELETTQTAAKVMMFTVSFRHAVTTA